MKTEFLKELGLEQEQINKVMAENGKDIAAEQAKAKAIESERDNYKAQLETAKESLTKFDGVDVEALKFDDAPNLEYCYTGISYHRAKKDSQRRG